MFIGALRHSWHFPRWNAPRYRTKGLLINSIRLGIEPRPGKDFFHLSTLHPPRFSSTARLAFVVVFSFSFSLSLSSLVLFFRKTTGPARWNLATR